MKRIREIYSESVGVTNEDKEIVTKFKNVLEENEPEGYIMFKFNINKFISEKKKEINKEPNKKIKPKIPKKKNKTIQAKAQEQENKIMSVLEREKADIEQRICEFVERVKKGPDSKKTFELKVNETFRQDLVNKYFHEKVELSFKGKMLTIIDKEQTKIKTENQKSEKKIETDVAESKEETVDGEQQETKQKKKRKRKRKRKKKKKLTEEEQEQANEKYLDDITAFRELEKTKCLYSKKWNKDGDVVIYIPKDELQKTKYCGKNIRFLSQLCKICDRKYCLTHAVPETHGCGDAARVKARSQMQKDFHARDFQKNEVDKRLAEDLRARAKRKIQENQKKRMTKQAKKNLKKMKK
jgi:hypothetical protein